MTKRADKPEKYIIYQTIIITVAKLLTVPIVVFIFLIFLNDNSENKEFFILLTSFMVILEDIIVTALIIQLSYICGSQSNLKRVLSMKIADVRSAVSKNYIESVQLSYDHQLAKPS
ncbi:unnamed protein product [Caenorhabditis bovis]|uniref:Uncharacterized protein n=1 Tax=Caenorhabditis bovis TaxID=2654633 RepID=A0A8S1E068_9PELO|nr:unnamed protein product [Caenorhabditis bovis]